MYNVASSPDGVRGCHSRVGWQFAESHLAMPLAKVTWAVSPAPAMPLLAARSAHWRSGSAALFLLAKVIRPSPGQCAALFTVATQSCSPPGKQVAEKCSSMHAAVTRRHQIFIHHFTEGKGCDRICSTLSRAQPPAQTTCPAIHPRVRRLTAPLRCNSVDPVRWRKRPSASAVQAMIWARPSVASLV